MRWILVSDASRARLFRTSSPHNDNWQLHESFKHGVAPLKPSELETALEERRAPLFGAP